MKTGIVFLLLLLVSPAALAATTHIVGGSPGWGFGINYDTWASGQTFVSGDSLVFNYVSFHSVDEVSESDYQNCNTATPINSYPTSPTTIPLTAAGTRYFICPTNGHCAAGMKVAVTTEAATSTGSPPPEGSTTPSPPPAGGSTPSPPSITPATPRNGPSTTTSSPPPPPSGSAATTTVSGLVAGTSVVLAALFGLMG